jgi:hypothetical protein
VPVDDSSWSFCPCLEALHYIPTYLRHFPAQRPRRLLLYLSSQRLHPLSSLLPTNSAIEPPKERRAGQDDCAVRRLCKCRSLVSLFFSAPRHATDGLGGGTTDRRGKLRGQASATTHCRSSRGRDKAWTRARFASAATCTRRDASPRPLPLCFLWQPGTA